MRRHMTLVLAGCALAAVAAPGAQAQGIGGILSGTCQIAGGLFGGNKNKREVDEACRQAEAAKAQIEQVNVMATLSNPKADPKMSKSQSQVHSYAGSNYQMEGAVGGGFLGGVAGCLVAEALLDKDCGDGFLIGAVLGAGLGYVVGGNAQKRQGVYADTENNLNSKLQAAQQDLTDAQATRAAAEMLVTEHRATLASLQQKRARNQVSREQYAKEVGYMMKDVEALGAAKKGLEGQLVSLKAAIDNTKTPADADQLKAVYVQLQTEDRALDSALRNLSGMVEGAKV